MPHRICSVDDCEKPAHARGWCPMHYQRWRQHGDPSVNLKPIGTPLRVRFDLKVDRHGPVPEHAPELGNCWTWTDHTVGGYGRIQVEGRGVLAHRLSYELEYGSIPEGAWIDHRCHEKKCVRPSHLRPATAAQNNQYRRGPNPDSRTGVRGVYPSPDGGGFVAYVSRNGRNIRVGGYSTLEEASAARAEAQAAWGDFAGY